MNTRSDTTAGLPKIVVVGTLNLDCLWRVPQLPAPGRTLLVQTEQTDFGGKGANQAVAAARQGANVVLIGGVGEDVGGRRYIDHLHAEGIDVAGLVRLENIATGCAHIYVDPRGENTIVVVGGANAVLSPDSVSIALGPALRNAAILLVQLESPLAVVMETLRLARKYNVRAILNASPYHPEFSWSVPVDTVIVNEHECRDFFGWSVEQFLQTPLAECQKILTRFQIENLVVTCGGEPTLHLSRQGRHSEPVHAVVPRHTVGAGDTFAGALAVRLAVADAWPLALRYANICAGLSTLVEGVQTAIPHRQEVEQAMLGRDELTSYKNKNSGMSEDSI